MTLVHPWGRALHTHGRAKAHWSPEAVFTSLQAFANPIGKRQEHVLSAGQLSSLDTIMYLMMPIIVLFIRHPATVQLKPG